MRILYLVGDSRSGSTLLQHLLSLQPGVHALGELRRLGALAREAPDFLGALHHPQFGKQRGQPTVGVQRVVVLALVDEADVARFHCVARPLVFVAVYVG